MLEASNELNRSKIGNTNIHESYFKIYMQLNLFWNAENENFGKILSIHFYLRTIPSHEKYVGTLRMQNLFVLRYVSTVR